MKTITLEKFIANEISNDVQSGFMLQGGDTIQDDINSALTNEKVKMQYYTKMVARYEKLQQMGRVSDLTKNEDYSISYTI